MGTLSATTDPTTGTIRIDIEQSMVRDTFTRVVANAWGTATTGQLYTDSGGAAADYSVNGTQGIHAVTSTNVARHSSLVAVAGADMRAQIQATIAVLATGAPIQLAVMGRFTDTSNHYFAEVSLATSNVATLNLRKNVLGVLTTIASFTLGEVHAAGATWNVIIDICGHVIRAKAWRSTVTMPGWQITANDFDLFSGTRAGARSLRATGNSNGTVNFTYDNFTVIVGQPIRLYRVGTDSVKTEVRGSPGSTEDPTASALTAVATFWDNEAPFDSPVFYELTSNCSTVVEITSNTVNLLASGDGWLRDPVDPALNIRLDFSNELFDYCTDDQAIVFSGLGTRGFANASGHFDIIDAQRVNTVSQLRKRYSSNLVLTSKTLEDGDLIEAIIASGRTLLLSLPLAYGFGRPFGQDYIAIFDISSDPIGVDQRLEARVWDLPFRLGDPTADTSEGGTGGNGLGGGDATYAALAASALGVTYANLAASGETYLQVAQGVGY